MLKRSQSLSAGDGKRASVSLLVPITQHKRQEAMPSISSSQDLNVYRAHGASNGADGEGGVIGKSGDTKIRDRHVHKSAGLSLRLSEDVHNDKIQANNCDTNPENQQTLGTNPESPNALRSTVDAIGSPSSRASRYRARGTIDRVDDEILEMLMKSDIHGGGSDQSLQNQTEMGMDENDILHLLLSGGRRSSSS